MSAFLEETEGLDEIRKEEPSAAIPPMVRFDHHVRSITRILVMYCGTRKAVSERQDYLGSDTPATAQEQIRQYQQRFFRCCRWRDRRPFWCKRKIG
jgi:hypothetical protein